MGRNLRRALVDAGYDQHSARRISWEHLRFDRDGEVLTVQDLGSTGETVIDGGELAVEDQTPVQEHSTLELADAVTLTIHYQ